MTMLWIVTYTFLFDNILICTLIKVHIILIITRINYNKSGDRGEYGRGSTILKK